MYNYTHQSAAQNSAFILGHLSVGKSACGGSRTIRITPNTNEFEHPDVAALNERQETGRFKSEEVVANLLVQLCWKLYEVAVLVRGTEITFEKCNRTPEVIQNRTVGFQCLSSVTVFLDALALSQFSADTL